MPIHPKVAIEETPNFSPRLYGIVLLVAGIALAGTWMVARFIDMDLARDMQTWREKLNLIAESRTSEVDNWISNNFTELRVLADNPSLQLYMTELQMMKDSREKSQQSADPAQKVYLRNLLLFTAQRSGFGAVGNNPAIPANVQPESKSGLAILDGNGTIIVSTLMPSATRDMLKKHVVHAEAGKQELIDIRKDSEGTAYIGFIMPIFSIQGDHNAGSQIGHVVGFKVLDSTFFNLLKHPGIVEKTLECILVRPNGNKTEYLSPLLDGSEALGKVITDGAPLLAEADLIKSSGDFEYKLKDYRNLPVLATSRQVAGTPWSLIVKIDKKEALATTDQYRAGMGLFLLLIIAVIVLIIFATWWRAHSKRSLLASHHFHRLALKSQAQERLLRLVADHQPESIYIVDNEMTVRFANHQASAVSHIPLDALVGRGLADVRGAEIAQRVEAQCKMALDSASIVYDTQRTKKLGKDMVTRSAYVPLAHIPVLNIPEPTPGALVVEQDISEVIHEREQRMKTQRQLIDVLLMLVDKRDPFAAHHSKLVSQISYEVALEMELDNTTVATASKAGSLMNIGKITVPTELLTKTSKLTAEEKRIIHDAMNEAAELMQGINFDGPVSETLRQWQEKWDGTGPLGLKGEDILISARIIAAANAFVGMISPRSWRTAVPIDTANKFMLSQADEHFDRRVVIALANFIENHNGREWIKKILDGHKAA